ncbi:MAG: hypothetical protein LBV67_09605, partial [Streptococcaceae bacterium]|nr:hypothetical protein [Streptococcaceae bacterium]
TIEANYQKKASDIRYLGSIQEKDYNKVKELSNQSQEVDYTKSNRVMTSVIDTFSTLSKTNELKESQLAVENNKNNLEDEPFNFLFGWTKDFNVEEYSMNGAFTEELQLNKDLEIFGRGANNGKIETLNYFSVFRTRDIDSNNSQQTAELVYLYDVIFNPATEKIEMLVSIGLDVNNNSGLQVEGLTDFNAQ